MLFWTPLPQRLTDTRTTPQGAMRSPKMLSEATKWLRYEKIKNLHIARRNPFTSPRYVHPVRRRRALGRMGEPHVSEATPPKGYPQGIRAVTMRAGAVLPTTSAQRRCRSRVAALDK